MKSEVAKKTRPYK